jgi:hypothetical protein
MELLDISLVTTNFQSEDKFYQQIYGIVTGYSAPLVGSSISKEPFEGRSLDTNKLRGP